MKSLQKFFVTTGLLLIGNTPINAFTPILETSAARATLKKKRIKTRKSYNTQLFKHSGSGSGSTSKDSLAYVGDFKRRSGTNFTDIVWSRISLFRRVLIGATIAIALNALQPDPITARGDIILMKYRQFMTSHPLRTKMVTGGILATIGDGVAQLREADKPYNPSRAASFAAFDVCYRIFQHKVFPFVTKICTGGILGWILSCTMLLLGGCKSIGADLMNIFAATECTLAYQFVVVPLLYYPLFFSFTGILQGLTVRETLERAKNQFLPCWKRNVLFWIPTQFVMFGFIEENLQVPFVCIVGLLWSTILSVTTGKVD